MANLKLRNVKGEMRKDFSSKGEKMKKILPRITLKGVDLPAMEDWQVGKKYLIVLEAEMVAMKKGQEYEFEPSDDKSTTGTFAIHAVGEFDGEEKFSDKYARVRSEAASRR